jgi:Flp pilus assembly protein TadB
MKLFVFVAIELLLSYYVATKFCGLLESASASRAKHEDGTSGRSLELGLYGRLAGTIALFVGLVIIALLSKWLVISTIIAMLVSLGLVWSNIYLRGIGIGALIPCFCVWIGNIVASLYQQSTVGAENGWAKFYIIFQIIMLALLLIGTAIVKFNQYRMTLRDEDEEAEETEELIDHYAAADDDDEDDTEADEDDDDWIDREERKEEIIRFILNAFIVILVVGLFVALGFWLETKFDFFPPYNI